jgi:hypothetical protein
VFGLFKRKSKEPPPIEWQCGSFRHVQILDALEQATDSTVALIRHGAVEWSRDVSFPLHEFTCRPVEVVLSHAAEMRIPVYSGRSQNAIDPNSAAMAMAQQQTESNAKPLEQLVLKFPDSFAAALDCKRRWLAGLATASDIRTIAQKVAQDTQLCWPSNFCVQINAMRTASWCVLSSLNIESPWLSAHGCAQTAASFLGCRAACKTVDCERSPHDTTELVWEAARIGNQTFTRGVGCPQVGNAGVENQISKTIQSTSAEWWQRLNEELASALIKSVS